MSVALTVFHRELTDASHQFDDAEFEVVGERPFYTPSMTVSVLHRAGNHV